MKQAHHIADFLGFLPRFLGVVVSSVVSSTSSLFSWLWRSSIILLTHGTQLLTLPLLPFINSSNSANNLRCGSVSTLVALTDCTSSFACFFFSLFTITGQRPPGQSWKVIFVLRSRKQPQGLKVTPSKVTGCANGFNLLSGVPHVRVVEL